jgi:flagellar biosynthesis protein FlhF
MRLKTYTAPTMSEAMALVRDDMGQDAIIVSTQEGADGLACRVTAAIEEDVEFEATVVSNETREEPESDELGFSVDDPITFLRQILTAHGLPQHLVDMLLRSASEIDGKDPGLALAGAIDAHIAFRPIEVSEVDAPLILVGVPGAGKTITATKLAAAAKLKGHRVGVVTADAKRAGGIEQLKVFTTILEIDLIAVANAEELKKHVLSLKDADVVIVDTAGVNPFDDDDMRYVMDIAELISGEPILVLPAGGDAMESADIAAAFNGIGAERMIVSRLDMTRRLGGILAAALAGRLAIANASINPRVADGLNTLNPVSLARLIVPNETNDDEEPTRAAQ